MYAIFLGESGLSYLMLKMFLFSDSFIIAGLVSVENYGPQAPCTTALTEYGSQILTSNR